MIFSNNNYLTSLKMASLVSLLCLVCGCTSVEDNRRIIERELMPIVKQGYEKEIYISILPAQTRNKALKEISETILDYYSSQLTNQEINELVSFYAEDVVCEVRRNRLAGRIPTTEQLEMLLELSEHYPVVKKVTSEEFSVPLVKKIRQRLLKNEQQN